MTVCPECDSAQIDRRTPGKPSETRGDKRWYCTNCQHRFDDAGTRDPIGDRTPTYGIARKLYEIGAAEEG